MHRLAGAPARRERGRPRGAAGARPLHGSNRRPRTRRGRCRNTPVHHIAEPRARGGRRQARRHGFRVRAPARPGTPRWPDRLHRRGLGAGCRAGWPPSWRPPMRGARAIGGRIELSEAESELLGDAVMARRSAAGEGQAPAAAERRNATRLHVRALAIQWSLDGRDRRDLPARGRHVASPRAGGRGLRACAARRGHPDRALARREGHHVRAPARPGPAGLARDLAEAVRRESG